MVKAIIIYLVTTCTIVASYRMNNKLKVGIGNPELLDSSRELPKDKYFNQKLDHFDPTDETTWAQRYWVNTDIYEKGKAAFLMINGEAEASAKWSVSGQWTEYAKSYNAACFLLEHRFYGNSKPTKDVSTANLKYLSSEQALADIAYFITEMKKDYDTGPWIVFGGSYAGSLAAWARLKYPHLIAGAVSSSGPLLAKIDFNEYFEVVENSLSSYSTQCPHSIREADAQLSILMESEAGKAELTQEFQLCESLTTQKSLADIQSFYENLAGNFADVVQYNGDNRQSPTKNVTIPVLCDIMNSDTSSTESKKAWKRYADVNKLMLKVNNQSCLSYSYENYLNNMKKTDWESASAYGRQWMYQTCTEFGFYQTSSKRLDLFGSHFPISFFTEQCHDIFGPHFDIALLDTAVQRTNVVYGEKNIFVERVAFIYGEIDPWHALGITNNLGHAYNAYLIPGAAHCADMYPPSVNDSVSLKHVRSEVNQLIGLWLSNKGPTTFIWFMYAEDYPRLFCFGFYGALSVIFLLGMFYFQARWYVAGYYIRNPQKHQLATGRRISIGP